MRPDGTRVKEASTIVSALPYVMPRRYDAQNFITEYADMEVLRRYCSGARSLANRARSVSNITPA